MLVWSDVRAGPVHIHNLTSTSVFIVRVSLGGKDGRPIGTLESRKSAINAPTVIPAEPLTQRPTRTRISLLVDKKPDQNYQVLIEGHSLTLLRVTSAAGFRVKLILWA